MLRVTLSIKAGRITPSTLLRKLGTYSKKNRLYQAFRELGSALRTEFLLKYLHSAELRSLIQAATNKSEAYNGFTQWVAFGSDGTIATNDREEQRKIIKYNHLVANCVIFHNVFSLSRVLHELQQEGSSSGRGVGGRAQPLYKSAYQSFWSLRAGYGDTTSRTHL